MLKYVNVSGTSFSDLHFASGLVYDSLYGCTDVLLPIKLKPLVLSFQILLRKLIHMFFCKLVEFMGLFVRNLAQISIVSTPFLQLLGGLVRGRSFCTSVLGDLFREKHWH